MLKRTMQACLRAAGLDVRRPPVATLRTNEAQLLVSLDHLVALRMLDGQELFFVQIGAFNGHTGDQLHEYVKAFKWKGILIEPQKRYFDELQATYEGFDGLTFVNAAVDEKPGTRTLWTLDPSHPGLPDWAPQAASFDRTRLDRAGFTDALVAEEVDCRTLQQLLEGVERIDLLQIDTEGYDAEIIRMFDFDRYLPSIVRFENVTLSRREHNGAARRLVSYGYQVAVTGTDTIAWHRTATRRLSASER